MEFFNKIIDYLDNEETMSCDGCGWRKMGAFRLRLLTLVSIGALAGVSGSAILKCMGDDSSDVLEGLVSTVAGTSLVSLPWMFLRMAEIIKTPTEFTRFALCIAAIQTGTGALGASIYHAIDNEAMGPAEGAAAGALGTAALFGCGLFGYSAKRMFCTDEEIERDRLLVA